MTGQASLVRFAIVGGGMRGLALGQAVRDLGGDGVVTVVCDVDEQRARQIAGQLGAVAIIDYRAAVACPDVDAVIVATPPGVHRDAVVAAARAGKHVLCEKPLAVEMAHADEMIAACRAANVRLAVGYVVRYADNRDRLRQWIREGIIGRPVVWRETLPLYAEEQRWLGSYDLGGGAVFEYSHSIDFACYTFGPPSRVFSQLLRFNPDPAWRSHDSYLCHVMFQSGDVFHLSGFGCLPMNMRADLTWGGMHRIRQNDIVGPLGAIYTGADKQGTQQMVLTRHLGGTEHESTQHPWSGWIGYSGRPDLPMLRDFIQAIRDPAHELRNSADQTRHTLAIIKACQRSTECGEVVKL